MTRKFPNLAIDRPIFVLGMPRSGTTWLSQILESHPQVTTIFSPNYSYALKNTIHHESTTEQWLHHLESAVNSPDEFIHHEYRRATDELPRFPKNNDDVRWLCLKDTRFHDLYFQAQQRLPGSKIIFIARHPAACLASWSACKEFPADESLAEVWRSGGSRKAGGAGEYWGFDDWVDVTSAHLDRAEHSPARNHVVKYEDLLRDPRGTTSQIFDFCELPMSPATDQFLHASRHTHHDSPYSVFRGQKQVDSWKANFPETIQAEIQDRLKNTPLQQFAPEP